MTTTTSGLARGIKDGARCGGNVTVTVVQDDGERFRTLAKNLAVKG